MDSAITSAPRTERRAVRRAAFSLVEVMIAAAISTFVLAGVLGAFAFISRTGFRSSSFSELEAEVRRALETFAQDVRQARDVRWNSTQSVTLFLPSGAPAAQVTYAFDPDAASTTYRTFYRVVGDASSTAPRRILVRGLTDNFTFRRYKLEQTGVTDNTASSDLETKQLQLVLTTRRTSSATAGAGQTIVSTRYVLRNKRVSN